MAMRISFFWECVRKAVHLSSLLIVIVYTLLLNHFSHRVAIMALTAILLVLLEIERIRLEHRSFWTSWLNNILRRKEKDNISGVVFMVSSTIICFSAFEYWIALAATFMTVFGDMFAALFGRAFGKKRIYRHKTWVGSFSGLFANLLVGIFLLPQFPVVYVPMAIVATTVEVLTHKLDDNLTVPIFAAFVGQMIVYYTDISLPPIDFTFLGLF
ncbi:phosphatidate cytidylyltransferase [Candidatus Peregrinibacteria bacterium]|nr:phosphatidate cytidylyltransferase [Candidatus Peregrinibacteria bacterium]